MVASRSRNGDRQRRRRQSLTLRKLSAHQRAMTRHMAGKRLTRRLLDLLAADAIKVRDKPLRREPWRPVCAWELRPVLELSAKEREILKSRRGVS
jgi:hypothetical protein